MLLVGMNEVVLGKECKGRIVNMGWNCGSDDINWVELEL